MNQSIRKNVTAVSLIMLFRMLGLFMVLPIFAVAAQSLTGATEALVGLALGIYGLTQAIFQIPLGSLSDRFGRKPIILLGMVLFALGSVVAGFSHSIIGVIIGRALQGSGAVGSTLLALLADVTPEQDRTKAMAMVGMTIGISFAVALIVGPLVQSMWGLSGIFFFTAVLALLGVVVLFGMLPAYPRVVRPAFSFGAQIKQVLKHPELIRLDLSIFIQHATLTLFFVAVPVLLLQQLHFSEHAQTILYLVVLLLAFVAMVPLLIAAEKRGKAKAILMMSIGLMGVTQLALLFSWFQQITWVIILLFLFFTGFTALEALLPSWVSKTVPANSKGTAMGVYSTCQFLGIFVGGAVGGLLLEHFQLIGVFIAGVALSAIWCVLVMGLKNKQTVEK